MENKEIMVVFYQTEIDEIMCASRNDTSNVGIDVRYVIRNVLNREGRIIAMGGEIK